jgi:hypothetical protein
LVEEMRGERKADAEQGGALVGDGRLVWLVRQSRGPEGAKPAGGERRVVQGENG